MWHCAARQKGVIFGHDEVMGLGHVGRRVTAVQLVLATVVVLGVELMRQIRVPAKSLRWQGLLVGGTAAQFEFCFYQKNPNRADLTPGK